MIENVNYDIAETNFIIDFIDDINILKEKVFSLNPTNINYPKLIYIINEHLSMKDGVNFFYLNYIVINVNPN